MCALLVVVPILLANLLPLPDPNAQDLGDRLLPPLSTGHLLGTDQLGRDLLSRVLHGGQSLTVHRALPPEGSATVTTRTTNVWDKGKAAVIWQEGRSTSGRSICSTRIRRR